MAKESGSSAPKPRRILIGVFILGLVVLSGGAIYVTQVLEKPASVPVRACKLGPAGKGDFTLPIVDRSGVTGKFLTLSSYKCQVIVLEFMAPWCPPCQNVVPAMEALYNQYSSQGVVFIAVEVAWTPDLTKYQNVTMTQFLTTYTTSLTYVYDSTNSVSTAWGLQKVPTLFLVSKMGLVNATYVGHDPITSGDVAKTIGQLLRS